MATEPPISSAPHSTASNPYEGRWRWWYSAIADWMIRNPGRPLKECAQELQKAENTIYYITGTDLFRDYFAKRRAEWQRDHDWSIRSRLTHLTELALDASIEKLEKQRDKVDLPLLTDLLGSSLDRLGFSPQQSPLVQINHQQNTAVVQLPGSVTASALEEARMALRAVQQQYSSSSAAPVDCLSPPEGLGKGDEPPPDSLDLVAEPEVGDVDSSIGS